MKLGMKGLLLQKGRAPGEETWEVSFFHQIRKYQKGEGMTKV